MTASTKFMEKEDISLIRELGSNNEKIEVLYRKSTPNSHPKAAYPGLNPSEVLLKKGTKKEKGRMSLPCDIIWERDLAVTMRDGTIIYTDAFRPADTTQPYPALIAWSPYGKMNSGIIKISSELPFNAGVPYNATSGYESFESPDPAYWCHQGYVVLTPDIRGTMMSGGNYEWWGQIGAEDGYDFIEWAAAQNWCTGKTALTGNSQLTIMQWFIASLNPPHLTCISPWEGLNDMYRNDIYDGGIKDVGFNDNILFSTTGNNYAENIPAMADKHPLFDGYWESKIAKVENIKMPAYVVSSYTHFAHPRGTFQCWSKLTMPEKWLRVHNTMEWPDFYNKENVESLRQFFDHYLKGMNNGWEKTPRVRISVLDPGGVDTVGRVVADFPLPQTQYRRFYLDAETSRLTPNEVKNESKARYQADPDTEGKTTFTMRFEKDTEFIGYFKLRLWVEAEGNNDMDLFAWCQKLDKKGRLLSHMPLPIPTIPKLLIKNSFRYGFLKGKFPAFMNYTGTYGKQKVSLRKLDEAQSTPYLPVHAFNEFQYLDKGAIVPVDISLWPTGMRYHAGEQFRLVIGGYNLRGQHLPQHEKVQLTNKGHHIIHTGGRYDSHLLIPVIPG